MRGYENWVEQLPETLGRIVIRVGGRGTLNQAAVVAIVGSGYDEASESWAASWVERDELADVLIRTCEDAGYPDDYARIRLDPYTSQGKRLPSKQWTNKENQKGNTAPGIEGALESLSGAVVSMAGELRRSNADLCRVLVKEREYSAMKVEEADQAYESMRHNDTLISALELLDEQEENEAQPVDPLRQSASDLLQSIGPAIAKAFGAGDEADNIREWVKENMEDLVNDPEMQAAFFEQYMKKEKGEGEPNSNNHPQPETD